MLHSICQSKMVEIKLPSAHKGSQRNMRTIVTNRLLMIRLAFIVYSLFHSLTGYSEPIPRYDLSNSYGLSQPFDVYIYEDKTQKLDVTAIADGQSPGYLATSRFSVKSTESNYWFVFTLANPSSRTLRRIIRFDEPYAETVDLHYRKDGRWHAEQAGLQIPVHERHIVNRNPVFHVSLAPNESKTFYIKLQSNYGMLTIGLLVEAPVEFVTQERLQNSGYFFYFGAAASLLIYNLFLFISLREKLYIYYVMHGLCYVIWVLLYSGFDLYLRVSPTLHYGLNPITSFILSFLALFTRSLLQTDKLSPTADKILIFIAVFTLGFGALCFIDIYYYQYLSYIALLTYLFFLVFGAYAVYRRIALSAYYLSSMVLYFVGIIALALLLVDVAPYSLFTRYFYLVGSLAELSIFSFALAYRIKLLQRQNTAYQESQIQAQIEAKNKLEIEVANRTKELSIANQELARLSKLDGLTGLGNRRLLDDWVTKEYAELNRQKYPCSLILCDIDFFKKYNDHYGHQKGDECLIRVARSIQSCVYQPNDIVIRYGGEEFLILLPDTDKLGASNVAARIVSVINDLNIEHVESDIARHVTLSLGVASTNRNTTMNIEELISKADKRLYKAKQMGRNQYCVG